MKTLNNYINEALIKKDTKIGNWNYFPKDREELRSLIEQLLEERGKDANLNDIDTSKITDMSYLFYENVFEYFNGDISMWDVSNVTNMQFMFYECKTFNCDLSSWDVSNVKNMHAMFWNCKKFKQNLNGWDVSNVENMFAAFHACPKKPKWYKK